MGRKRTLPDPDARPCEKCGELFTPVRKKWRARFCSLACQWEYAREQRRMDNAEQARATAVQRGNTLRGRGEGKAYTKLRGRHMHRIVAEQKLGRPLLPGETVHHADGNKKNNDPDNIIVLMNQAEHARIHAAARRKKVMP